jgi:hypothetical protein
MMTNLSMIGLRVEVARDSTIHVKKTLPPSLSNFPGEADIRYYIKATVVRPQFFKENIRTVCFTSPCHMSRLADYVECNRLPVSTFFPLNPQEVEIPTKKRMRGDSKNLQNNICQ